MRVRKEITTLEMRERREDLQKRPMSLQHQVERAAYPFGRDVTQVSAQQMHGSIWRRRHASCSATDAIKDSNGHLTTVGGRRNGFNGIPVLQLGLTSLPNAGTLLGKS
jgi:hypothetical protein